MTAKAKAAAAEGQDAQTPPASPPASPPVTPPDNDGDGHPGGRDPLHPYAVLLEPLGALASGKIVYGPAEAIEALVDASGARMATPQDLSLAGVHVHPLPA